MKLDIDVVGDAQVRAMLQRIGAQLASRALTATAIEVEDYVETEVGKHTKTGALFQSIYRKPIAGGWEIGHDLQRAPHAVFVHWGSKPHPIVPRKKKALRWAAGGGFRFARRVKHPGYRGDPWLVRAAALAPAIFRRHVELTLANLQR